jgi:hypothetical protein
LKNGCYAGNCEKKAHTECIKKMGDKINPKRYAEIKKTSGLGRKFFTKTILEILSFLNGRVQIFIERASVINQVS